MCLQIECLPSLKHIHPIYIGLMCQFSCYTSFPPTPHPYPSIMFQLLLLSLAFLAISSLPHLFTTISLFPIPSPPSHFSPSLHHHLTLPQPFTTISLFPIGMYEPQGLDDQAIDGDRCALFAKFLSEEFDISYVAIFLHTRAVVQQELNIKLTDANQPKLWVSDLSTTNNSLATTLSSSSSSSSSSAFIQKSAHQSITYITNPLSETSQSSAAWIDTHPMKGKKRSTGHHLNKRSMDDGDDGDDDHPHHHRSEKAPRIVDHTTTTGTGIGLGLPASSSSKVSVVPVTLPSNIHFVEDFTIVEAPLLSFDISLLSPLIGDRFLNTLLPAIDTLLVHPISSPY